MNPDIHALTGAYALNACDDDERVLVERHLLQCQTCATEVKEFRAVTGTLGTVVADQPPARLKERVLDRISADRDRARSSWRARNWPGRRADGGPTVPRRWARAALTAAAACLALAVVLTVLVVRADRQPGLAWDRQTDVRSASVLFAPDSRMITARGLSPATGIVVLSHTRDMLMLITSDMRPPPRHHAYQLWLVNSDNPRPAGLLHTTADGDVQPIVAGSVHDADRISVTLEPAGGSDHPTGSPVLWTSLGG